MTRLLGSFGAASRCQCACHLQVVDELVDEPHRRQMLTANLSFATDMVIWGIYIVYYTMHDCLETRPAKLSNKCTFLTGRTVDEELMHI